MKPPILPSLFVLMVLFVLVSTTAGAFEETKKEGQQEPVPVAPGAEVIVFVGTWCGDSKREVPRLWKALDETGGMVPFAVRYVGVDRDKKEPAADLAESAVRYLPTFIVVRDGRERGRIVETSPHGVERDLLDLLTGKARGVLATREDLTSAAPAQPPR